MICETIALHPFEGAYLTTLCLSNSASLNQTPRRAVIVCPGGGYGGVVDREKEPIAAAFLARGFATFMVHYTTKKDGERGAADYKPLKQVALAIRYVRENAARYNVDPNYIFTCGFSAGGHLAASAGVLWDHPELDELMSDAPKGINRPTGMILSYPVITAGEFAHRGSILNLCGSKEATQTEMDRFSLEKHVNSTTPPAFLWHTFTDTCVPVQNSLLMADAMTRAKVPFEMHIFPEGVHGLALADEQTASGDPDTFIRTNCACWVDLAATWMRNI